MNAADQEFEATISPYEDTMTSLTNAESDRTDRITDDDDDEPTSGSETYEEGDLLASAMDDDVTAQLAAAGWQFKHANGDFHFFAFSNLPYPETPICPHSSVRRGSPRPTPAAESRRGGSLDFPSRCCAERTPADARTCCAPRPRTGTTGASTSSAGS